MSAGHVRRSCDPDILPRERMINKRTYTASEIRKTVDLFRKSPDILQEQLSGMEMIAGLCVIEKFLAAQR